MAKRAVLVGCNYPGSYCPLYGCINDVTNMRKILMEVYGFKKKNIVFMVDTDEKSLMPTGKNIVQQLGKSIRLQSLGMCFISISVATEDDTFRLLLANLNPGVAFTFVFDSCHSGGLLDSQELQVGVGKEGKIGSETASTRGGGVSESAERKIDWMIPRRISTKSLIRHLAQASGHEVKVGTIRSTIYQLFQEDASPTVKVFVKNMSSRLEAGIPEEEWANSYNEVGVSALKHLKQIWDDRTIDNDEYFRSARLVNGPLNFSGHANVKPTGETLPPSTGILVSGCQSDQTSADMPGDNGSYGALSNAVQTLVRKHAGKFSNKQLVNGTRAMMVEEGLDQRPCLYCSKDKVNAPFICSPL
ncbi:hypothetical protein AXG93_2381s1170 [Marchantia polymorpha subsp. ruderalis]|uniref:Peptidase C14 caspase domain-containing protein n=1 Tax=Marchantia polymorpha subsp. ruderalis TaxID=1480154 RepID=A0A176VQ43_MARPO|nr:hypothetical protein AXG93_2381s1170 [Marchantia polymorpha subsp. ruderalis]